MGGPIRAYERSGPGRATSSPGSSSPRNGDDRCGANAIVLAKYMPGRQRVTGSVRTLPRNSFTYSRARDLRNRAWHTYAVEITKRHISWFVDTRVVRTETRAGGALRRPYRPSS